VQRRASSAQRDLSATQTELEELRRRRAEAEERLAMVKELTAKLQKMIDTGKLGVVVRGGRMIVEMPAAVLFESGSAELSEDGKATLKEVAAALRSDPQRRLIVAGHTDNQPIVDADFRNNWELSAARAVIVTEVLVAAGLRPKNLVAAGYGEFHPVGDNKSPQGRAQNRRIELVIQPPELDQLPELMKSVASATSSSAPPPATAASAAP
jgi:chemotaxis protein MotB